MSVSAALLCLLATHAAAAPPAAARPDAAVEPPAGIFQLPLVTVARSDVPRTKRQVAVGLDNVQYDGARPAVALGVTLQVGTPPQTVLVEPDTGSEQLWVPGGARNGDAESVYFDRAASTSLKDLNKLSAAVYGVGTREAALLDMVNDEVAVGGKSIGKLDLGVGKMDSPHTTIGRIVGVMGLRPAPPQRKDQTGFVPQKLLDAKIVKTRAFSMALRAKGQGQLTFGGYDTSKFSGPLEKMALQSSDHYVVSIKSVSFTAAAGGTSETVLDSQTAQKSLTLGLDSGAPALTLMPSLLKALQDKMQAKTPAKPYSGLLQVACDVVAGNAALDFQMTDSTTVSVPLGDLVRAKVDDGKTCVLAIQPGQTSADLWIGGPFLRRSLVVYDPDDNCVYVARGANCGSSVVAIDGKMPTSAVKGKCDEEQAVADESGPSDADKSPTLTDDDIKRSVVPADAE